MSHLDVVRLLGVDAPARPEGEGYGRIVPEDFELLVRALPQGVIAASVLLGGADVPVRSLEDFTRDTALRIADMREALESREQELWAPLHPRPHGMVPWGRTADDGVLLWDTAAADTADWTTVLTDTDFQFWLDLPFSASEFVARALRGRAEGTPAFETYQEYESGTFWKVAEDKRARAAVLANRDVGAVEEIVTRLRSIGVPGVRAYAEELLDRAAGAYGALPEDYLAVMREFPGGVVAGVRVFPASAEPGAPALRRPDEDGPFLQWGEVGGRAFGWLTAEGAPEEWRVAHVEPDGSALTRLEDQTFATFLRRRLRGDDSLS
ncbi:hypothetical protein EDD98_6528 [Streptomyces sp. PanSC19]|uniref:hypothetical protein n=1 Tax=Streptomyces sp. PanSC19 TaxID=1520455 RepID=UPI000F49E059|nr:hypothetical protein [Streptomyces sp. PanSC19]ROQ26879.1 hypothetical protein EDD98_6528 [Streptomyces sp. PanSC19]